MENKTCVECKYHNPISGICIKLGKKPSKTLPSCPYRPTNGDRIRQMSNEELVRFKGARHCTFCAYCDQKTDKCNRPIGGTCSEGILEWLNAPADCVAENGKSAKQADLCCKSAKESEGHNEETSIF